MSATGIRPDARDAAVAVRRFVNDEIAQVTARSDLDDQNLFEFMCECGELSCARVIKMTLGEYRASEPGAIVAHPVRAR